jgi:hypothetical protein
MYDPRGCLRAGRGETGSPAPVRGRDVRPQHDPHTGPPHQDGKLTPVHAAY